MKKKSILAVMIAAAMAFQSTVFAGEAKTAPVNTESISQTVSFLQGQTVSGFTVESCGSIESLGAQTYYAKHEKSGAGLYIIDNDDNNKSFNIIYRTPYVDETDTNHVFEHAVLASCAKYPSKDIFFDMMNKTYSTYINAHTFPVFTSYPLSSQSEEQLLKMMDVYLSCLVDPDVLHDENIFMREALRYELYDKDSPITMKGIVFSEDFRFLTDINQEMYYNIGNALYPGQTAANMLGRAHMNYKNLTFENTVATFDRCYSFDNALIVLYGNMDYQKVMKYLDDEFLSKSENKHTDLSEYMNEEDETGFVKKICYAPAYKEDQTENASIISYAFSLYGKNWDEILDYKLLAEILSEEGSVFNKKLEKEGINNTFSVECDYSTLKPNFIFCIENAEKEQMDSFERAVKATLEEVGTGGIPSEQYETFIKQLELSQSLEREGLNTGLNISHEIGLYWTRTGKADFYELKEQTVEKAEKDIEQSIIKKCAGGLLNIGRSCLIATVPKAGLAEQIEQEMDNYLAEKKNAMTDEDIERLIKDTKEFNEWNESEGSNSDFTIPVENLPDVDVSVPFDKHEKNGITWYKANVQTSKAVSYNFYFDTSAVSEEDLYYIPLYMMLAGSLDTDKSTKEQIALKKSEYLNGFGLNCVAYPDNSEDSFAPFIQADFNGLPEDSQKSMELLLEIMQATKFDNTQQVIQAMETNLSGYDLSKQDADGSIKLAYRLSQGYHSDCANYKNYTTGQDAYYFMKNLLDKLKSDPAYGREFSSKMNNIASDIVNRSNMKVTLISNEENLDSVTETVENCLNMMPVKSNAGYEYLKIPQATQKYAAIVEMTGNFDLINMEMTPEDGLKGQFLPFICAVYDKVLVQKIRFENGAYGVNAQFMPKNNDTIIYSYSDPNVKTTFDILENLPDYIDIQEISQEELDGYILTTYAQMTQPEGNISKAKSSINLDMNGIDSSSIEKLLQEVKDCKVSDKQQATEYVKRQMKDASYVSVGSQSTIEKDKEFFEQVKDYRKVN